MSFELSVSIHASIGRVWKAWTSSGRTTAWLAPRANVDFRPGGAFEFFWSDDPHRDSTLGCVLLQIEPERRLRFEWQGRTAFLPMFLPPGGKRTVIEVTFEQQGQCTLLALNHPETRDDRDWADYEAWMSRSWEAALAALKALCEKNTAEPAG